MSLLINFDLGNLTKVEARALVIMLSSIEGVTTMTPKKDTTPGKATDSIKVESTPLPPVEPDCTPQAGAAVADVAIEPAADAPETSHPTDTSVPTEPVENVVKGRRGRPKKETPVEPTVPAAEAPAAEAETIYDVPFLRAKLKAFTERHDVQAGIDLLKDFGCSRVTDMAALPRDEQETFINRCDHA